MMGRGYVQVWALLVLVAGVVGSTLLTVRLSASAGRHQLVYTTKAEAGMTSEEALGIAAGAFRGLFVNMLWMRAQALKQDGKYWEATDLARTITRLQPRFPRAWAFHGWNLAYNISVATQTPEERWQWVDSGVRLLRNEGIPKNPNDMLLHRELAWILLHKVQGRMDDANNYYKARFAREWTVAVGPPPERSKENRERSKYIEESAARMDLIASGVGTVEELRAKYPLAGELADALLKDAKIDIRTAEGRLKLLEQRELIRSVQRRMRLLKLGQSGIPPEVIPEVARMFSDPSIVQNGLMPLIAHVRKRVLVEQYNMEPERMARYIRKYGPLDWRHPAAHALYWGAKGVEAGQTRVQDQNRADFDFINTDRIAIHALQEMYRTGVVQYDILMPQRFFVQMTAPDFIKSYDDNVQELLDREAEQMKLTKGVDMASRVYRFYSAGYENFLADAIVLMYRRGQLDEARAYKDKLASWQGRNQNDYRQEAIRTMDLEEYVAEQIKERTNAPNLALQEVYGSLQGAFYNGLLAGDDELFRTQYEFARKFHRVFMEQQYRQTNVDPNDPGRMAGVMSANFADVAGQVLYMTIELLGPIDGSAIFSRAPEEARLVAFDLIELGMERDEKGNIIASDMQRLFPEPAGFKAFRARREEEFNRKKIERGQQELK
jgi:hypothetical protein